MKLISLYIENFGTLSRYELNLDAGLTAIYQPNGFGKTTLAEFIRAMLYGFPRKTKTLEKSRRQKYAPWNGGVYGGNLVFEHEGQRYRLERTFGATPKGDTFTLIDLQTNQRSVRFSEEIGTELFVLDADSFERSTYLPQNREDAPLSTAAIQAKLSDLVEDSGDVNNFDKAMAALKAKRSALIPYRGSGGAVAEAAAKITELQVQLDDAWTQQERLSALQQEAARTEAALEEKQAALAQARQALTDASESAAAAVRHRQYEALQAQCRQAAESAVYYQKKYPKGLPDAQALTRAETAADRWAVLQAQEITTQADQQAQAVLEEHVCFASELPTKQELEACRRKCEEYETLQGRIRNAELACAEALRQPAEGTKSGPVIAGLMLGIAAAAAGTVLLFLREFLIGGIGLGIGLAVLITAALLWRSCRNKRRALEQQRAAQSDAARRELDALRQTASHCSAQIGHFLSPFFGAVEPQRFLSCLTRLEHNAEAYTQARQQVLSWQDRKERHMAEMSKCRQDLEAFFAGFGLTMEENVRAQLRQLREDARAARMAAAQSQELAAQAAAFREEHGQILSTPAPQAQDVPRLKQEEQRLREELTELTGKLLRQRQEEQALRARAEQIPQLQAELEQWQCKKAEDRENARILDDTMDFLQRARENLSTSYLGTIQSRFGYYLSKLEGVSGEKFLIDTDLQVQLERMGQARELAYFSAGQTDLVMLCMRLALVDALFKGQETVVILDDPFVNLDDAHTAQALALLQSLCDQRQILYLTCHTSRMVQEK